MEEKSSENALKCAPNCSTMSVCVHQKNKNYMHLNMRGRKIISRLRTPKKICPFVFKSLALTLLAFTNSIAPNGNNQPNNVN